MSATLRKAGGKEKIANINKVYIFNNRDSGTITATFLGTTILNKVPLPLDEKIANEAIELLSDTDKRVEFCHKRGITEQMANEAVRNGAVELFAKELLDYSTVEPVAKKPKNSAPSSPKKNDDLQSPSPQKTPAMKKARAGQKKKKEIVANESDVTTPPPEQEINAD